MSDENKGLENDTNQAHELSATPLRTFSEAEVAVPTEVAVEPKASTEEGYSMEAAMAALDGTTSAYPGTGRLRVGDVVDGVVVHIDVHGVMVDVGAKSEGFIKPGELASDPNIAPEDVVSVNDKIKVYVLQTESAEGGPLLSKKRADFEKAWDKLEKAHADRETIKAMVSDRVKGGLVVDLGIRGFCPASHVASGKLKNLDKFIGQSLSFKVIEVDRERRKVVVSNRLVEAEEQAGKKNKTWASIEEGQILDGIIRRVTDYGAFVDVGGVDGLLHVSEMSWSRIGHPSDVVKVGQKIQVMVLKLNRADERVSLGLRQILPDPWEGLKSKYKYGDVISVTVTRIVQFGAFVQVENEVEGIIPSSELARRRINNPEEVVSIGQTLEAKVIDLRPEERRMTLSLKQLEVQRERDQEDSELRSYKQSAPSANTTIGDLIGGQLMDMGLGTSAAKAEEPKVEEKAAAEEIVAQAATAPEVEAVPEAEKLDVVVEETSTEELGKAAE